MTLAETTDGDARLLAAHDEIGVVLRHRIIKGVTLGTNKGVKGERKLHGKARVPTKNSWRVRWRKSKMKPFEIRFS